MPHPKHPEIRCETCVFFEPDEMNSNVGWCQRKPPHDEYGWPHPKASWWCGEHPAMAAVFRKAKLEAISRLDAQDAPKEDSP